jgi:hypothetical protein
MRTRRMPVAVLALLLAWSGSAAWQTSRPAAALVDLPVRLADQEFWRLTETMSEQGGTFHSDNFVSNEGRFQTVIPELVTRVRPGGVYLGVGPEQNFTYMSAVRPRMAFIVDIRRGNLQEHLLYKALLEMSSDRADFLGRLFARPRPAGLGQSSTPEQLFDAYDVATSSDTRYRDNLKAVLDWLGTKHGFGLHPEDIQGIGYIYRTAFYADGPALGYTLTGQPRAQFANGVPTYAQLMTMEDGTGHQRSFLASEQNFAYLKDLETRNLVVPVVGDFGGTRTLRAVGKYIRERGATVNVFYLSNVEQYLRQDGKWETFCANVASLPIDGSSTVIRSIRSGGPGFGSRRVGFGMFTSSLAGMQAETRACGAVPIGVVTNMKRVQH